MISLLGGRRPSVCRRAICRLHPENPGAIKPYPTNLPFYQRGGTIFFI